MRITFAPPAIPLCSAIQPGVAAHHLHHHHPVVRLGGGVQPVDRVRRGLHRGVEPERQLRGGEVVVDRLRHADDADRRRRPAGARPRACPRRRSRSARRCSPRRAWCGPARCRRRTCTGSCATSRGSCRRAAGSRAPPRGRGRSPRRPSGPATRGGTRRSSGPCTATPLRTIARITALRPGQSPPPVRIPMRMLVSRSRAVGAAPLAHPDSTRRRHH